MFTVCISALVAFLIVYLAGPVVIPLLHRLKFGQVEREEGPESHKAKQGTPTMGGLMMLLSLLVTTLFFGLKGASFSLPALLAALAFGAVGFLDDFIKVKLKRNLGLRAWQKIVFQVVFSAAIALWAYKSPALGPVLYLPISGGEWNIGGWYIPLVMFAVIGTTNAVNLTDGLDGLASGVTMVYSGAMTLICLVLASSAGVALSASYTGLAVFAAALTGACLGFLRYNTYPARVFMGDTGSLALGGAVVMLAIESRSLLLLPVMGFCFVGSALSVILQVGSYKLRHGKRIFKMAPIHHHFELKGYPETQIVAMYRLLTAVLCLICLLSYLR